MSEFGRTGNPHRLYRNRENAMIAGVCAGVADYFGFNRKAVRLVVFLSLFIFPPVTIIGYLLLAIMLPARPAEVPQPEDEEARFWRGVSNAPADVFSAARHRFRELDRRLQRIEAFVTSREFEIDRELGRGPGAKES